MGLPQAPVIYDASHYKREDSPCAYNYNAQGWAYTYLSEHPKLVEMDPRKRFPGVL